MSYEAPVIRVKRQVAEEESHLFDILPHEPRQFGVLSETGGMDHQIKEVNGDFIVFSRRLNSDEDYTNVGSLSADIPVTLAPILQNGQETTLHISIAPQEAKIS